MLFNMIKLINIKYDFILNLISNGVFVCVKWIQFSSKNTLGSICY